MLISTSATVDAVTTTLNAAAAKLVGGGGAGAGMGCKWPLLIKPNSGGFGAGIKALAGSDAVVEYAAELAATDASTAPSADGVLLLQEYVQMLFLRPMYPPEVFEYSCGTHIHDQQQHL